MHKVFKYEITSDEFVSIPEGVHFLKAAVQNNSICVWAMVDLSRTKKPVLFKVVPTGGFAPDDYLFIDTVFLNDLVFHVFARA